jgi:hypothetical protein
VISGETKTGTVGLFVDDPSVAVVYFLDTVDLMLSNLPTPYLQFWVPIGTTISAGGMD